MKLLFIKKISRCSQYFMLIFFLVATTTAQAKEVSMEPSIRVGVGYSDNIELEHTNEKSSAYTSVTPGIKFAKEGARVKSSLDYRVTGLFYNSESDLNEVQHYLNARAFSEIIEQTIFLDMNASVTQELLDNNQNASSDGVSGSQNLSQTYSYGVSPSWKEKWGNLAESELKYNYNEVTFDGNSGDDSTAQRTTLSLVNGTEYNQYFWTLDFDYNDVDYDRNRGTQDESYKLMLGYHYSHKLDFTFTTGYEDYDEDQGRDDGGSGWRVGAAWTPSNRTSVKLEAGHRFFGNTYLFDFKHTGRRLTWHFKYDDDITNTRASIINNNEESVNNPDGTIVPLSNFTALYFLTRRFVGDVSYQRKKSTFTLGMFDEGRYYTDSDRKDEQDSGVNFTWNLNVSSRTNMIARISYNRINNSLENNTQKRKSLNWSLNHQLAPDLSGGINLSFRDNDADFKADEYRENAVSAYLTKNF